MATWQLALLLLALVWALQSLGVWLQMRHYAAVMKGIRNEEKDGFLGTGYVRGRLSKGSIAIVVTSEDGEVRTVRIMTGRSSLAKFRTIETLRGLPLAGLEAALAAEAGLEDAEAEAVRKAVRQIEDIRQKRRESAPRLEEARPQTA